MSEIDINCLIFIDYDNLPLQQKTAGILDIVTRSMIQVPFEAAVTRSRCEVRVYGGWYEGASITKLAQDLSIEIQRDFPAIIRLPITPMHHCLVSANAELAVALLQEPGHHLFHTYRRKGKPSNVRVEAPTAIGCNDPDCILPLMKKLLRTGACPKPGCTVVSKDLVYRHEQKIVDTMLTCDLIYAADSQTEYIVLVSDDDDFLPPLRTVLLRGTTAIRFHTKPNSQRASFPSGGLALLERDL